jgi:hypothetical protein
MESTFMEVLLAALRNCHASSVCFFLCIFVLAPHLLLGLACLVCWGSFIATWQILDVSGPDCHLSSGLITYARLLCTLVWPLLALKC